MKKDIMRSITIAALVALAGAGCMRTPDGSVGQMSHAAHTTTASASMPAADLRATFNSLFGEHIVLAASATGAALAGRETQFKAIVESLDANSVDISKAIGLVYGPEAEKAFLPLWRKHIGFAVEYTLGVATKDKAKQDRAVAELVQYTEDFGAFLNSANPNLPKNVVADLVKTHVLTLKDVIDAQAAGDQPKAFAATRTAYAHMRMIADPVAGAIAKQFPTRFTGQFDSPGASLRIALNNAFAEHVYLAARATGAALGGRDAELKAAAAALDGNSVDISKAIGSVYGGTAEQAFLPLWRRHIGFVVDYTTGLAAKNKAAQDKAVNELVGYTQDLGAFLSSANPNLPKDAVADLLKGHILSLKDVVDAQAAGNQAKVYTELRAAMGHMRMIGDPLAAAIAKQFPQRFASR
jgi:hypothetical protein